MHHYFHHRFHDKLHRFAEDFGEALCIGRGRHGRGFGHFGAGFFGGPGFGGGGFRTGRKLASGELQLVLLALLADRPSHGYELIKALEERSGGFYVPSPGMVYPALTWLEEVGYASVTADGAKKLYAITDEGRKYLDDHREAADAMLEQLELIGRRMGRVREAFSGPDDDEDQRGGIWRDAWLARRELKSALRDKRHAGPKEAKRIAEILRRAAAEIRGDE
ncbi:MAG: PadR family transcriptional regulator [Rudaea sp.]|uniref:PadR family transcriptional regulator n=1 Tax=unclassified Rudaea TaxID=2627037 RepID=UPI0010F808D4|nr:MULTISPECIES: PadR family transcriptional regulator [unclassified Rudaea]MBN8884415.1 PadR family transcriptional regulator [Rudaea sp.]MBR0344405.1 PadR family transcriptional regulator [Rudaea sp.]